METTASILDWAAGLPAAVTVCDPDGTVLYMNERAAQSYANDGGRDLIGRSLLDCHPEPALSKLKALLESRQPNTYTIEKNGQRKLIYQAPLFEQGEFRGFAELSIVLPTDMPHYVRK